MIIRGHHLLCMLGFRGYGYDDKFVSNMREIVDRLHDQQDLLIKLVDTVDNICMACPNNINGNCKNEHYPGSIKDMDDAVLKIIGVKPGVEINYNKAMEKIKNLMTEKEMNDICKYCSWKDYGYCMEGLKNLDKRRL